MNLILKKINDTNAKLYAYPLMFPLRRDKSRFRLWRIG